MIWGQILTGVTDIANVLQLYHLMRFTHLMTIRIGTYCFGCWSIFLHDSRLPLSVLLAQSKNFAHAILQLHPCQGVIVG